MTMDPDWDDLRVFLAVARTAQGYGLTEEGARLVPHAEAAERAALGAHRKPVWPRRV
jgi:DNA-binding transcriptional LysR family regulator